MGIFSPTAAKRVASNPADFSTEDIYAAMDMVTNSEAFTEKQVTAMHTKLEAELAIRKSNESPKLTSDELLFGLNRAIWAIQESGRYEDAEAIRAIRDRAFDFKAMGMED